MFRRFVAIATCTLALSLASLTAAHAGSRQFVDGPGDVWTTLTSQPRRAPNHDEGDILRTTLSHRQHQVVVRTTFAELRREGRQFHATLLRTNTGLVYRVQLQAASRNHWRGRAVLYRGGSRVDCTLSHSIDYATNVVIVRVPRNCLNNPRTVQAKFGVGTISHRQAFADNPINHGPTNRFPPYTAPVRRG